MKNSARYSPRRSQILKSALGAGLFSTFSPLLAGYKQNESAVLQLAKSFSRNASIQRLGSTYIRMHPDEANTSLLIDLLEKSSAAHSEGGEPGIEKSLDLAVRRDFDTEHIENVSGWCLARTEARLYALSALLA